MGYHQNTVILNLRALGLVDTWWLIMKLEVYETVDLRIYANKLPLGCGCTFLIEVGKFSQLKRSDCLSENI